MQCCVIKQCRGIVFSPHCHVQMCSQLSVSESWKRISIRVINSRLTVRAAGISHSGCPSSCLSKGLQCSLISKIKPNQPSRSHLSREHWGGIVAALGHSHQNTVQYTKCMCVILNMINIHRNSFLLTSPVQMFPDVGLKPQTAGHSGLLF